MNNPLAIFKRLKLIAWAMALSACASLTGPPLTPGVSTLAEVIATAKTLHQSVKGFTLFHKRDGKPIPYGTLYHQWSNACRGAKVEDAHFHDIRAAAATDAKAQGLDSKTLLGHTTESSHNRYLRSKETKVATPNRARKS